MSGNVSTKIQIDATPEHVWDIATDLEQIGEWVTIHRGIEGTPPADIARGTRFGQKLGVAGVVFKVDWTATEVADPETITWEGTGPRGTTARTTYSLTSKDGGTSFAYENEFKLPGSMIGKAAGRLVAAAADREATRSLARLKKLAEK